MVKNLFLDRKNFAFREFINMGQNNVLNLILPIALILLMTFLMLKTGKARQQEASNAYKKELSIQEENNNLLKEILKTLKRIEKNSKGGAAQE